MRAAASCEGCAITSSGRSGVEEFRQFYEASYPRLYRELCLMAASPADAEDVLQEAYARAAGRWSSVRELDSPEAWVRRVGINRCIDLGRRRIRQRRAYSRLPRETEQLSDVSTELLDLLARLPAEQRQVLVLHHLLGETTEQIAVRLDRPVGTVKGQLVRGRAALRGMLTEPEVSSHD